MIQQQLPVLPDSPPGDNDLAVECPFCGNLVDHPGQTRAGSEALAECDHCDIYFDFTPADVIASSRLVHLHPGR